MKLGFFFGKSILVVFFETENISYIYKTEIGTYI